MNKAELFLSVAENGIAATKRLYYDDQYLESTQATVFFCAAYSPEGRNTRPGYAVCLDETLFFPEGGGQPSDKGTIASHEVTDCFEENGVIFHITDYKFDVGERVDLHVDVKDCRIDYMRQHTGEHILSYSIFKLFSATNVGFHMNRELSTCDFDMVLTQEQLRLAEDDANREILKNRAVFAREISEEELPELKLRKKTSWLHGEMRVVFVEGGDSCTCCGLHVAHTGEVGLLKISASERLRGGTRLYFLCGERALGDYCEKSAIVSALSDRLSAKPADIISKVDGLYDKIKTQSAKISEKNSLISDIVLKQAETLSGFAFISSEALDADVAKETAKRLVSSGTRGSVVYRAGENRLGYIFVTAKGDENGADRLCAMTNAALNGRGGGKRDFASGTAELDSMKPEEFYRLSSEIRALLLKGTSTYS